MNEQDGGEVRTPSKRKHEIEVSDSHAILLVEDNPNDALFVGLAFKRLGIKHRLIVVRNGLEAIEYLQGSGRYADRRRSPLPRLVLLDLDMPAMNGFEVLAWVRGNPFWRQLPVIVLTSSTYSTDITRAYRSGANSFVVKPFDFAEFVTAMKETLDFWFARCKLPEAPGKNLKVEKRKQKSGTALPAIDPKVRPTERLEGLNGQAENGLTNG